MFWHECRHIQWAEWKRVKQSIKNHGKQKPSFSLQEETNKRQIKLQLNIRIVYRNASFVSCYQLHYRISVDMRWSWFTLWILLVCFLVYECGAACYFHFVWHMNIIVLNGVCCVDNDDALAHDLIKFARFILVSFFFLLFSSLLLSSLSHSMSVCLSHSLCVLLSWDVICWVCAALNSVLIKRRCTFDSEKT